MLSSVLAKLNRVIIDFKILILKQVVEKSLAEVKLSEVARVRSSSYSGGMKRRLTVAIALIGEPKLIILDEPVSKILSFFIRLYAS